MHAFVSGNSTTISLSVVNCRQMKNALVEDLHEIGISISFEIIGI
jgi:hypothetical protein